MTNETPGLEPAEDAPALSADSSPAPLEPEVPATPADDAGPPRDEKGQFLSPNVQKRIDHLTWEKNEREREAAYWRDLATRSEPKPEPKQAVTLPTLESVGYDESQYQQALLTYATEVAKQEARKELEAERGRQSEQRRLETFAERQREFAKSTPDYEAQVLSPSLPISEAMRDVIVDSPSGPELAYYLATNREAAAQIARLPAHMAALEMGRIEGRLMAQKEAPKAPQVSKAPPPPPKVEAVDPVFSVKTTDPGSDKLSDDEWVRAERKRLSKKR